MDISLYCSESGAGFPLILLHGNGEDHTYFREQALYFSEILPGNRSGYQRSWTESPGNSPLFTDSVRR